MRDSEIVALLATGGREEVRQGLAAAYAAYGDRIYDYAHWMLRGTDPAAAADVTHDTFLIAVAKVGGLRNPERFRSWLYAIARNECLRVLRVAGRSDPLEYGDGTPHPALVAVEEGEGHEMSAELSRGDLRELVRTAAAGLSPKDREVFELGMRHDLQAAEIAKALGVGDNAAHAMLSRVRSQFERALGALTVARHGRESCPDLDSLLSGWDGSFGPLWRKRIARHVESCATCTQVRSREVSASALLSVVPLLAAPALIARPAVRLRPTGPGVRVDRAGGAGGTVRRGRVPGNGCCRSTRSSGDAGAARRPPRARGARRRRLAVASGSR